MMDPPDFDRKDVRRPMNAFLIFCKRHRTIVREKNPNLDNRSVTRILGDLWANLGDEEKTQYTDLAKQYKDAFMKANPDYKWHNPDKLLTPVCISKSTPRSSTAKNKEEGLCSPDQCLSPGKLADPSNMGGLSLLLMAGQQSSSCKQKLSQYVGAPSPEDIEEESHYIPPTSSLSAFAEMCSTQRMEPKDEVIEEYKIPESSVSQPAADADNEEDDGGLVIAMENEGERTVDSKSDSYEDEREEDENAIVACGKVVMDHIIDRLYSSSKPNNSHAKRKRKVSGSVMTKIKDPPTKTQEVKEEKHIFENLTRSRDELERKLLTDQKINEDDAEPEKEADESSTEVKVKIKPENEADIYEIPPVTVQKNASDFNPKKKPRKKKRYYSEGHDVSENSEKIGSICDLKPTESDNKRQKLDKEEPPESTDLQDIDPQDIDMMDDEYQPIRKSKRRNRGQRYQELIDEGIIQPSKERLAARRVDSVTSEESYVIQPSSVSEEEIQKKPQDLGSEVLSMYPRQIRKRTRSESEKTKVTEDSSRYKTGDFDLEAHIAILPACSLEKVAKPKRTFPRPRTTSESSRSSVSSDHGQETKAEIVLTIPPHLKAKETETNSEPVVGSRKRKARKHSITRLTPVNPSSSKVTAASSVTCPEDEKPGSDDSKDDETTKGTISCSQSMEQTASDRVCDVGANSRDISRSSEEVKTSLDTEGLSDKEACRSEILLKLGESNYTEHVKSTKPTSPCTEDTSFMKEKSKTIDQTKVMLEHLRQSETVESGKVFNYLHANSETADEPLVISEHMHANSRTAETESGKILNQDNTKFMLSMSSTKRTDESDEMSQLSDNAKHKGEESCETIDHDVCNERDVESVSSYKQEGANKTKFCDIDKDEDTPTQVQMDLSSPGQNSDSSTSNVMSSSVNAPNQDATERDDTKRQITDGAVSMTTSQVPCSFDPSKPKTDDSQPDTASAFITMEIGTIRNSPQDSISSNLDAPLQGVPSSLQTNPLKVGLYVNS